VTFGDTVHPTPRPPKIVTDYLNGPNYLYRNGWLNNNNDFICYQDLLAFQKKFVSNARGRPGVDFINSLQADFIRKDPKSAKKKQSSQKCLIVLLGSACIKAAPKWW
jgi:hypothetical protein